MITPTSLFPPQPATTRAQSLHLSYDKTHDRIAYPNGKSIVVRPVDPDSKVAPKQYTKHNSPATVATFAPSGNYVASGDESGQVKIWDTAVISGAAAEPETFACPNTKSEFQILAGPIKSIAWDADSSRVIAVGQGKDKFGHCFTWDSGNSIGEIQGHAESINAVAIKPQRPYRAATVSDDKALVFYTGPPFKFDKSVRGHHTNTVRDVKFSPDGAWLVSTGLDRSIVRYDGKTGEYVDKIENAHNGGIFGISWFTDSSAFVTASADGTVKSWTPELKEIDTYTIGEPSVTNQQVGVVVTNNYIVSLSYGGNLNYFVPGTLKLHRVIGGHQTALTAVKLIDKTLYTGSADGAIYTRKFATDLDPVPAFANAHKNYVVGIASADTIVSTGWDDKLKYWDDADIDLPSQPKKLVRTGKSTVVLFEDKIEVFQGKAKTLEISLGFSSNDADAHGTKVFVTDTAANTVREYSIGGGAEITPLLLKFPPLRGSPSLVRVSPDGQYVAVADTAGKYTVFNAADATPVTTRWAFHTSKVYDAKWTSDSKYVLSGGLDSGLFVYSIERPSKVLKFPLAHQSGVSGVEWLEYDGKKGKFATTGLDGVVKTWEVEF